MNERTPGPKKPEQAEHSIEVGCLVMLRDDVDERILNSLKPDIVQGVKYRVEELNPHTDGVDVAWIAPADATGHGSNTQTFQPFPIGVVHLRRLAN